MGEEEVPAAGSEHKMKESKLFSESRSGHSLRVRTFFRGKSERKRVEAVESASVQQAGCRGYCITVLDSISKEVTWFFLIPCRKIDLKTEKVNNSV